MKISFILILVAISFNSSAGNLNKKIHFFVYDQYGKVLDLKEIVINDSKVIVEGQELSDTEVILKSKYLKLIHQKKSEKASDCSLGRYILKTYENEKSVIESGCLGSKRFSEIYHSFKKLRKDIILK